MHKYFGFGCSILIPVIENLKSNPKWNGGGSMELRRLTRREFLILSGSSLAAARVLGPEALFAQSTTIRQGFQTNIWGMPTYYLLRSGALEKRGLKFEEFAVPSGNLKIGRASCRE